MNKLLFLVSFYLSWYLSVKGAVIGHALWGPCAVAIITVVFLFNVNSGKLRTLFFIATVTIIGTLIDSISPSLGLVSFASIPELPWGYPLWLVSLWTIFGIGFGSAMLWLQDRYLLASVVGIIGGPLSYMAGASMGAIHFQSATWMILLINAIEWSLVVPALLIIYKLLVLRVS